MLQLPSAREQQLKTSSLLAAALALWATPPLLQGQTTGRATVAYVSGQSVYVSAGSHDGLLIGDTVQVWHADSNIAQLQVAYLSSHQASCTVLSAKTPPIVGDSVRYSPHPAPATGPGVVAALPGTAPVATGGSHWENASRLRGRVAARFLSVQQQDGSSASYSQPALDIRLDGQNLGGTPIGLVADVRSRRTAPFHRARSRPRAGPAARGGRANRRAFPRRAGHPGR